MWNECKCAPTWSPCCRRQPSSRVSAKQQDRSDNIRLGMVGCIFQQKQQRSLFKAGIDINEHAWRWLKLWTSKTISWLIKTYIVLFSEEAKFIHTSSKGVRARLDFKMHSEVRTWRKSCLKKKRASRRPTHFQSRVSLAEFLRHPLQFPLKKKLPDVLSCLVSVISCHICFCPSSKLLPQWTGLQASPSTPALHCCFPSFRRLPDSASLGVSHRYYRDVLWSGSICGLLQNSWKFVTEM